MATNPFDQFDTQTDPTQVDRSTWDKRADGSTKGMGFLGLIKRPDGKVSSELSIGVPLGGKETEIPTMVPGLSPAELNYLLTTPPEKIQQGPLFGSIRDKAVAHAQQRVAQGLSPFLQDGETPAASNDAAPEAGGNPFDQFSAPEAPEPAAPIHFKDVGQVVELQKQFPEQAKLNPQQFADWFASSRSAPTTAVIGDGTPDAAAMPVSAGRALHMGVGDVAQGVGSLIGLVSNPANAVVNAVAGTDLTTDMGKTLRDLTGAPAPERGSEKLISAVNQGGTAALAGVGAGEALAGAVPAVARFGADIAANPIRQFIAGLSGAAGAHEGEKVGGLPGALIGAAIGGTTGLGATRIAERLAEAFPRSVMLDEAGNLSQEGREIAQRVGADASEVPETYARLRKVRARTPSGRPIATEPITKPLDEQSQAIVDAIHARLPPLPPAPRNPFEEAGSEGVRLTRGQAEQDFAVQNDENSLRLAANKEGEEARQFFAQQAEQIKDARDRFLSAFGGDENAADRGERVQKAVEALRDAGLAGVRQLYRDAEALGGEALKLKTDGIHEAATDVLIDEAVPEPVKRSISQELARYGIVGKAEPINDVGITKVALDDGSTVSFRGPIKELTASNAEDLRKAVNRLFDPMKPNLSGQSIKPAIDEALEEALVSAADAGEGKIGDAYKAARNAYMAQKKTFNAKDVIDNLTAVRKGTETRLLLPERAIAQVLGQGPKGVTNLKQVKSLLMSSNRPQARQAWRAIQQQQVADIFDGAITRNANGGIEEISGAKLRTQIHDKVGIDKLRTVLDESDFNQLMKLERIIGKATIPLRGTTNPSGTFTKLVNFLGHGALKFTGGFGDAAVALAKKAKDIAATRKTLEGITSYDGRKATVDRLEQQEQAFIRDFITVGKTGALVPKSIGTPSGEGN